MVDQPIGDSPLRWPKGRWLIVAVAYDCTQSGKATAENTDGDNYFCAATSSDLKSVFIAAMGSLTKSSKLMALPNVT